MTDHLLRAAARLEQLTARRTALAILLVVLSAYGARHVARGMGDFQTYRRASLRLLAGEPVYRLSDPHRYLYAPVHVFLFVPIAVLPELAGKIVWLVLNLLAVASILRLSAGLLFAAGRAPPGFHALVLLFSFRFIDNNLGHGQMNLILLWLVLAAYRSAARGRVGLGGLALGLAIVTKFVPGFLLLELVLRRRWRFAAATLAAVAVVMAAPALWWGAEYPRVLAEWSAVVRDQAGHYAIGNKINQSITAFVHRTLRLGDGATPPAALEIGLTLAVHAAFVIPMLLLSARLGARRRITEAANAEAAAEERRSDADELSLYLLYTTVLSPYSWKYYFANLLFPLGAATARVWTAERPRVERVLWAVFLLNLLPGLRLFGKHVATLFQLWSFHFLSVVVLFALLAKLAFEQMQRTRPEESAKRSS